MVVSSIVPDSPGDYKGDPDAVCKRHSDKYDINDPQTREHEAYKIAQANAGRPVRRFWYGDDVDAEDTNHHPHEADNDDPDKLRLQNFREA